MEVLVVLAISVILMGLVLAPVVQSFNMTRRAQAMADAQDAARGAMEQLSREIGEAMYVYDNTAGRLSVYSDGSMPPGTPLDAGPIQVPVRLSSGAIEWFVLQNAKIDLILPKITMHCNNPGHGDMPRDYPRGDDAWPPCPVCQSTNVDGKPSVPLQRENTIVRYFLGLRYNDPSPLPDEGPFGWKSPWGDLTELGEENQIVLYRAEFDPNDPTLFPAGMSMAQRLSDPIFFYRPEFCRRWADVAQVVGVGKYEDLVSAEFNSAGDVTSIAPTVTFSFSAIDNDPFSGTFSQDKSFEYPDTVPTVFAASYGYWISGEGISVYRTDANNQSIEYTTEYVNVSGARHLMIVKRTGPGAGTPEFDITDYLARVVSGNLTTLSRPGGGTPEMAFIFDYSNIGSEIWLDFNRGIVNFALTPPKPAGSASVATLYPAAINNAFANVFRTDRGSARRLEILPTFDDSQSVHVPNARIVPGSERVVGPDMTPPVTRIPGSRPNLVRYMSRRDTPVTYERVPYTLGDPGINQYKIDYDTGVIYFSSVYDQNLPDQYANGTPAVITVDYKIYLNRPQDAVKGSYTTKSLVKVQLGMKMFDPESGKPHAVDLNNSIRVRNALR